MYKGDNKLIAIIICSMFIIVGGLLLFKDIHASRNYVKTESVITLYRTVKNEKKAKVTYEYDGKKYEDKTIDSYNGFTMKDGKNYTVYINPEKPDQPVTVSYALDVVFVGMGVFAMVVAIKGKNKRIDKESMRSFMDQ